MGSRANAIRPNLAPQNGLAGYQVAAICYRHRRAEIEFLLVQTDGGRWTFPKGQVNSELGARKSAHHEALEEAGAYGLIGERPFHTFRWCKGVFWKPKSEQEIPVLAFLLEVTHQVEPEQKFRKPTWFSPAQARERLCERREMKHKREMNLLLELALLAAKPQKNGDRHLPLKLQ